MNITNRSNISGSVTAAMNEILEQINTNITNANRSSNNYNNNDSNNNNSN